MFFSVPASREEAERVRDRNFRGAIGLPWSDRAELAQLAPTYLWRTSLTRKGIVCRAFDRSTDLRHRARGSFKALNRGGRSRWIPSAHQVVRDLIQDQLVEDRFLEWPDTDPDERGRGTLLAPRFTTYDAYRVATTGVAVLRWNFRELGDANARLVGILAGAAVMPLGHPKRAYIFNMYNRNEQDLSEETIALLDDWQRHAGFPIAVAAAPDNFHDQNFRPRNPTL